MKALQLDRAGRSEPSPPTSWTNYYVTSGAWTNYFGFFLNLNVLRKPDSTPGLERLLNDFIQRGSEVGGRKQRGLGAYWQWIVYTYGPALLESLGTFRFLLTELVPLQLILEHRGSAIPLEDADPSASRNRSPPPSSGEEIPF